MTARINVYKYVDKKGLAAMLAIKVAGGVTLEVNLRNQARGKQGIHDGFVTQGRRHQKSKTGVSVTPQTGLMSSNFFSKKPQKLHTNINAKSFLVSKSPDHMFWNVFPFR